MLDLIQHLDHFSISNRMVHSVINSLNPWFLVRYLIIREALWNEQATKTTPIPAKSNHRSPLSLPR